jgi:signal recognition particle subunit SRP54
MSDMMKAMGKGKGMFARMGGMMGMPGMGGGMAPPDPAALEQLAKGGGLPGGMPGGLPGGLPGLPGMGGPRLPGLGGSAGLPGLPKKK